MAAPITGLLGCGRCKAVIHRLTVSGNLTPRPGVTEQQASSSLQLHVVHLHRFSRTTQSGFTTPLLEDDCAAHTPAPQATM